MNDIIHQYQAPKNEIEMEVLDEEEFALITVAAVLVRTTRTHRQISTTTTPLPCALRSSFKL